jgi:hypothetical protein
LAVRKLGVYLFSFWTLLLFVFFLKLGVSLVGWEKYFLFEFALVIVSIFLFNYIKKFYYYLANKLFFYSLYETGEVVSSIVEKLMVTLSPTSVYSFIDQRLSKIFTM